MRGAFGRVCVCMCPAIDAAKFLENYSDSDGSSEEFLEKNNTSYVEKAKFLENRSFF